MINMTTITATFSTMMVFKNVICDVQFSLSECTVILINWKYLVMLGYKYWTDALDMSIIITFITRKL